jgi:hypothetical protein
MKLSRIPALALIGAVLALAGCKQDQVAEKYHPAKLDSTEVKGIMKVTLDAKAAERIGLETGQITEERVEVGGGSGMRRVIPYGALMYDTKGNTWVFTNPSPLVFRRAQIKVEDIDGNKVILADGPPVGTSIVTVGAAMLMGAEHKYGH